MARIRTIKPEFPQSESIGRLSRDARLLFLQLLTIVDDCGRTRGASRILASLLYPYDDDVFPEIDGWIDELRAECIVDLYSVEGSTYLQVHNFLKHQKIDHPSESRIPEFREEFANPRESSRILATDLVSSIVSRRVSRRVSNTSAEFEKSPEPQETAAAVAARAAKVAKAPASPLFRAIMDSFRVKTKSFTNEAKEAEAVHRLEKFAQKHSPEDPAGFTRSVLQKYWDLTSGSDSFWSRQPFTPSALSSSGIFDRVVKEMESDEPWNVGDYDDTGVKF